MDNLPDNCSIADIDAAFGEADTDCECSECGEGHYSADDDLTTIDGDAICDECIDRLHLRCEGCDVIQADGRLEDVDGQWYCAKCAAEAK